jgi:hypothetical protein
MRRVPVKECWLKVKTLRGFQGLLARISQLQSKSLRQGAEGTLMSVIVFHEKAGRSQVGSFLFSLDRFFFLPSLPLTPSFHSHSSCRPEANRPETNRREITGPEPNRPPQPPPPNVRPDANRPEPDHQQARPDRLRNRQNRRMKRRSSSKNCRSHDGKRATSLRGWRVVGKPATQISKRLALAVSEMSTSARRL